MTKTASICLVLAVTFAGCATPRQPTEKRGQRESLAPSEYMDTNCISAFDAVKRLRPRWLWARGPVGLSNSTPDTPKVVVDDMLMGDVSQLRWIPLTGVQEMRFLDSGQATVRYGLGFTAGAIVIRTCRRSAGGSGGLWCMAPDLGAS